VRAKREAQLREKIKRIFDGNFGVYGARKVWRQLIREGETVARCTIERLMSGKGLQGAIRGKRVKTTVSDKAAPCPLDKVNGQFGADRPAALWVADFTYVATWQGFVYVAFAIDVLARRIFGWRASRTAHFGCVLDARDPSTSSAGLARSSPCSRCRLHSPQRAREPIPLGCIHRAPERCGRRARGVAKQIQGSAASATAT